MSVLLDTGIVYAFYDRSDDWHARARRVIEQEVRGLVLPAPVIPEVDHLLGHRLGSKSRQTFYKGLIEGLYFVVDVPRQAYSVVADINREFADLDVGFVDAAIVAVAASLKVPRVATADRRHFVPLAKRFSLELLP